MKIAIGKQMIIVVLMLVGALNSLAIEEAECAGYDLAADFGPVENQTGLGWCYAYTATDLLNFKFFQTLNGQRLSPADLAISFNDKFLRKDTSAGGFLKMSIEGASEFGICPRSYIEEQFESEYPLSYIVDGLKNVKEDLDYRADQNAKLRLLAKYKSEGFMPKNLSSEELLQIFDNSNANEVGKKLFAKLCGRNKFYPSRAKIKTVGSMISSIFKNLIGKDYIDLLKGEEYKIKTLSEILKSGQVVGVSVYGDFLRNDQPKPKFWISHSMTVVGQKWNAHTKSCEYHMRNSWGEDCSIYASDIKASCHQGYIWVDEKILKEKLLTLVWLE